MTALRTKRKPQQQIAASPGINPLSDCLTRQGPNAIACPNETERHDLMSQLTRILSVAAIASIALAGQAFAHAHLKSSEPADKAAVAAPSELDLTFTEELNLKFSGVTITGPDKTEIKLGDAMLEDGGKVLMVPVSDKLAPGSYTVDWHVLSTDGHKTNGAYSFTVKP